MLFSFFWGELGKLRRTNKYRVTRPHRVQAPDEKTQRRKRGTRFRIQGYQSWFRRGHARGDNERYDFILNYRTLRWRVQVKSTERFERTGYRVKGGGSTADYRLDEIDFLAAYVVPEEVWYVVPVSAVVRHKSLRFFPYSGSKGRLEKYRDAWRLFKLPALQTLEAMPHLL